MTPNIKRDTDRSPVTTDRTTITPIHPDPNATSTRYRVTPSFADTLWRRAATRTNTSWFCVGDVEVRERCIPLFGYRERAQLSDWHVRTVLAQPVGTDPLGFFRWLVGRPPTSCTGGVCVWSQVSWQG